MTKPTILLSKLFSKPQTRNGNLMPPCFLSQERLRGLWLKAVAASDPAEIETLLSKFRDALHEYLEQVRAGAKKRPGRV
jgi:hypothetical protein